MKEKILKILEECKSKGHDDLMFKEDREYIAKAIAESGTLIELPCLIQDNDGDWLVYFMNTFVYQIDYYKFDATEKEKAEERLKELENEKNI